MEFIKIANLEEKKVKCFSNSASKAFWTDASKVNNTMNKSHI